MNLDWGAIATLVAVGVALFLGITSIRQENNVQKILRKEKAIKEILNWAVNISEINSQPIQKLICDESDKKLKAANDYFAYDRSYSWKSYMTHLAKTVIKSQKMEEKIINVINKLDCCMYLRSKMDDIKISMDIIAKRCDRVVMASLQSRLITQTTENLLTEYEESMFNDIEGIQILATEQLEKLR